MHKNKKLMLALLDEPLPIIKPPEGFTLEDVLSACQPHGHCTATERKLVAERLLFKPAQGTVTQKNAWVREFLVTHFSKCENDTLFKHEYLIANQLKAGYDPSVRAAKVSAAVKNGQAGNRHSRRCFAT